MTQLIRVMSFTALFAGLGLLLGASPAAADDDKEMLQKAQKDILELVKDLGDGKDVSAKAKELKKKYEELNTIMYAYKPRGKGGIGFGTPNKNDSIEKKLQDMDAGRGIAAAALKKDKEELVKLARINIAIAEITSHYAPAKAVKGKGAKEWAKYTKEQKEAAVELSKAVEEGSMAKVKTAAKKLNAACDACHGDFRAE